jgi:hypothetical protein
MEVTEDGDGVGDDSMAIQTISPVDQQATGRQIQKVPHLPLPNKPESNPTVADSRQVQRCLPKLLKKIWANTAKTKAWRATWPKADGATVAKTCPTDWKIVSTKRKPM